MGDEKRLSLIERLDQMGPSDPIAERAARRRHSHCFCCQKELTGRRDRKYCSPKCHDDYNNAIKAAKREDWKAINGPIEQNDRYLAQLYSTNPRGEWPMAILQNPLFDGTARWQIIKDDYSLYPGKRYLHYSIHINEEKKTFKILYHGQHLL